MSIYRTLFNIGKSLFAVTEISKLLPLAMDEIIRETRAERGMIVVYGKNHEPLFETARALDRKDIERPEFEASKTVIESVRQTGHGQVIPNALRDPALQASKSIARLRVLSVACAPLRDENESFGVIYIDHRNVEALFDDDTGKLLAEFAELISLAVKNALERRRMIENYLKEKTKLPAIKGHGEIVFNSPAMAQIIKGVEKIAKTDVTVLITGESGTGKDLIARIVHDKSARGDKTFEALNCAALPDSMIEAELFGYKRGAFTDAKQDRPGAIAAANHGTLFLDEIGEMSLALQAKLLRFLQFREYKPLGSDETKKAEVRIIAATNRNLPELIRQGKFREDFYARLSVVEFKLPPLRERREEVLPLAFHFLHHFSDLYKKPELELSLAAQEYLEHHDFPFNIRELKNMIQRAVLFSDDRIIQPENFQLAFSSPAALYGDEKNFKRAKAQVVADFERRFLLARLRETNGNVAKAAALAEMPKPNFHQKMKKYGIHPKQLPREEMNRA
jgi:transcriptional regulator with GAF, ATPase, and Fis domain